MTPTTAAFAEAFVDVDGFCIRYLAAGPPSGRRLVWLHGGGGLHLSRAHAILAEGGLRPSATPEDMRQRLYAHPERQPARPPADPAVLAKQRALRQRLPRPSREETEARLAELNVPTLVVFGTRDGVIAPSMGRIYRERMPNCNYVLVFDAGHEVGAERPEAFTSLIGDFLERREAAIVTQTSSRLNP